MAKFDIYQHVTDQIITAIEAGTPPWRKPWTGSAGGFVFPLRSNNEPYRGINVLMLWLAAEERGFSSAHWFTYRQAQDLGGQVRKGEKSSQVVKYGTFERETEGGDPETVPYAKAYRVFNADQIDDLSEHFYIKPDDAQDMGTTAEPELLAFFEATGARIETSNTPRAFYSITDDYIHMPPVETFHSARDYFATLAHEACHFTGHKSRLDRFKVGMNKQDLALEELCAEIGSAMVCARLGLVPDFEQNAAYVESWLKALKEDKRAIFRAASAAQKAADFLFETAPEEMKQAA